MLFGKVGQRFELLCSLVQPDCFFSSLKAQVTLRNADRRVTRQPAEDGCFAGAKDGGFKQLIVAFACDPIENDAGERKIAVEHLEAENDGGETSGALARIEYKDYG